eukprot:CFRG2970T1
MEPATDEWEVMEESHSHPAELRPVAVQENHVINTAPSNCAGAAGNFSGVGVRGTHPLSAPFLGSGNVNGGTNIVTRPPSNGLPAETTGNAGMTSITNSYIPSAPTVADKVAKAAEFKLLASQQSSHGPDMKVKEGSTTPALRHHSGIQAADEKPAGVGIVNGHAIVSAHVNGIGENGGEGVRTGDSEERGTTCSSADKKNASVGVSDTRISAPVAKSVHVSTPPVPAGVSPGVGGDLHRQHKREGPIISHGGINGQIPPQSHTQAQVGQSSRHLDSGAMSRSNSSYSPRSQQAFYQQNINMNNNPNNPNNANKKTGGSKEKEGGSYSASSSGAGSNYRMVHGHAMGSPPMTTTPPSGAYYRPLNGGSGTVTDHSVSGMVIGRGGPNDKQQVPQTMPAMTHQQHQQHQQQHHQEQPTSGGPQQAHMSKVSYSLPNGGAGIGLGAPGSGALNRANSQPSAAQPTSYLQRPTPPPVGSSLAAMTPSANIPPVLVSSSALSSSNSRKQSIQQQHPQPHSQPHKQPHSQQHTQPHAHSHTHAHQQQTPHPNIQQQNQQPVLKKGGPYGAGAQSSSRGGGHFYESNGVGPGNGLPYAEQYSARAGVIGKTSHDRYNDGMTPTGPPINVGNSGQNTQHSHTQHSHTQHSHAQVSHTQHTGASALTPIPMGSINTTAPSTAGGELPPTTTPTISYTAPPHGSGGRNGSPGGASGYGYEGINTGTSTDSTGRVPPDAGKFFPQLSEAELVQNQSMHTPGGVPVAQIPGGSQGPQTGQGSAHLQHQHQHTQQIVQPPLPLQGAGGLMSGAASASVSNFASQSQSQLSQSSQVHQHQHQHSQQNVIPHTHQGNDGGQKRSKSVANGVESAGRGGSRTKITAHSENEFDTVDEDGDQYTERKPSVKRVRPSIFGSQPRTFFIERDAEVTGGINIPGHYIKPSLFRQPDMEKVQKRALKDPNIEKRMEGKIFQSLINNKGMEQILEIEQNVTCTLTRLQDNLKRFMDQDSRNTEVTPQKEAALNRLKTLLEKNLAASKSVLDLTKNTADEVGKLLNHKATSKQLLKQHVIS